MCTMTDPKSMSTQCDAGVPSRPIGLTLSSRSDGDDPVRDRLELPLRAAGADHEVVSQRRQRGELEQHDVGGLLVLGQLDDAAGEVQRRRGRRSWRRGVSRCGRPSGLGAVRARRWGARVRSRSIESSVGPGTAHGRRYTPRPHPGRGSAPTGRPPREPGCPTPTSASAGRPARRAAPPRPGRAARPPPARRPGSRRAARRRAWPARAPAPARARSASPASASTDRISARSAGLSGGQPLGAQAVERVGRVRRPVPVDLDRARLERRVARDRRLGPWPGGPRPG